MTGGVIQNQIFLEQNEISKKKNYKE